MSASPPPGGDERARFLPSAVHAARVHFALIMREMTTRFARSRLGYVWAILEPVGFIALLSLAFAQIAHRPPLGTSFPLFYATGYVVFDYYNQIAGLVGRSVQVNRPLFVYPAVQPLDAILARFALQALTGLVVAALIIGGILAVFADAVRLEPRPILMAVALAALLGLGVGMVNVTLFAFSKGWELVYGIVSRPLFLISAVFFTFDSLPRAAQAILWWNPLVHLVGLVRSGFYPFYDGRHVEPLYVFALALSLIVLGLVMLSLFGRRILEVA